MGAAVIEQIPNRGSVDQESSAGFRNAHTAVIIDVTLAGYGGEQICALISMDRFSGQA
jgi:hypothetical protein